MRQTAAHPTDKHKALVRTRLRSERSALPAKLRRVHDQAISKRLLRLAKSRQVTSVACFWPFNGEPDILPACRQWLDERLKLALPVISANKDHAMQFHTWQADSRLADNRYGIPEPQGTPVLALAGFDMLLMPLVAYDRCGNRLGMGAGYYDRHLESLRDQSLPLRVGIAYSLQEIEAIDKNKWDIPLHGVVNEHGWFTFDEP